MATEIRRDRDIQTVTIASSGTESGAVDGRSHAGYGLIMPAAFTGTSITFKVCDTHGGTYVSLYDRNNVQVSVTVAASRAYDLPSELYTWPFWKIVSGSAEAAERTLTVVAKG